MKKGCFIFIFLVLAIINSFAKSFYIEGKKINSIDFAGYDHINPALIQDNFTPIGIEVQDAFFQSPLDEKYNSYFAIGHMPKVNKGINWSKKDFVLLRESIKKQIPQIFSDVQSLKKTYKDYNLPLNDFLKPEILVNNDICICYSTVLSFEIFDFPILSFAATILVNEKVIVINFYDDFQVLGDYETAKNRYMKFLNTFLVANGNPPVVADNSKSIQPKQGVGQTKEIQDALDDALDKFLAKELSTYSSSENPDKNDGLSFTFKFPKGYRKEEGIRPETLRSFTSPTDKNGFEASLNVQIAKLPDECIFLTDQEIADVLFSDLSPQDFQSTNDAEILYSKKTKYEGQPGHFLITLAQIERGGLTLNCLLGSQRLIYKGHIIALNTAYYCFYRQAKFEELKKRFEDFFLFSVDVNNYFIINKY